MKLIVLSAFCVIAFTTFSEVAGFDSAEKEDVSEIQNGTYSSGELKDIDYDLDTTRGPVDPSNPPTAPTPAGPVQYTTNESIITVTELTTTVPPESGSDTVTHCSRHRGHKDGIKQLSIVERFAWLGVLTAVLTALFKVYEHYLH
ncbi:uncharacterized protein LOC124358030 isoform X2 [Homalodisca vitripennis]|uniref:uncharacterized protein LOC124358030 isoform X2 n=1 Tax=Homalodisca vitripennis TaxID=197043 RepID=UPI001EEAFD95|nr:uncharacterized protein LOC124358030 isoform X2 [Homalodisca vitripennis]